jgi:hypothetical protein
VFCAPGLVFGGTEGVRYRFLVLRARTRFRRFRGRRVPFSCFALPNSYSTVPTASGPVFMFSAVQRASLPVFMLSAPAHVFGGTEGVRSHFHVLYYQTRFRRYRGHWVLFSCFARPDSFSAVPKASSLVFMFCAPGLVFGGTEGVGSRFYVLRSRTHFRRYRGRPFPYSCFPLPDMFSAVPRASTLVFMFCTPRLIFGGSEGVGYRFHVFRSRTRFHQYLGLRVPFSYFACPNSFSAVPRASGPVFVFCLTRLVFGCIKGVRPLFMFCAPGLVFDGTEGVGSCFHVLRVRTSFRRYRRRPIPLSCFPLLDMCTTVSRASGPFFMFCPLGSLFRRYRGRQILFSRFTFPD